MKPLDIEDFRRVASHRGCAACGFPGDLNGHHILPRRAGGKTIGENIIFLCSECHRALHHARSKSSHKRCCYQTELRFLKRFLEGAYR